MFNSFGNVRTTHGYNEQDHSIGPVIKGNLTKETYFQLRGLFGISEAENDFSTAFYIGWKF